MKHSLIANFNGELQCVILKKEEQQKAIQLSTISNTLVTETMEKTLHGLKPKNTSQKSIPSSTSSWFVG